MMKMKNYFRKGLLFSFFILAQSVSAQDSLSFLPAVGLRPFDMDTIDNLVPDADDLRAGLLYDVKRDKIVWEKDMDYAWPIASLTKMMVGLLTVEDIAAGKLSMSDTILVESTYRKRVKRRKYTTYKVTQQFTLNDLLKMAMVRSHNESTVWIAKHCSGDVQTFVDRMNARAAELGMTKTHYNNPSGLPSPGVDNSASPRDLLILALECLKHPDLMAITSMPYADVKTNKSSVTYRNHNGLTINYTGEVDGIKTGYTKAAGFCLVATTGRADHRLISIILGTKSPWIRNGIVAGMMNSYYDGLYLGRLGDAAPDKQAYNLFMDSLARGLASVHPKVEAKHKDDEDASFAFTYKTVNEKVKKTYVVRSGDNLSRIAEKYNCSVADLKRWNKLKSNTVMKGQRIYAYQTVKKRIPIKLEVMPCEDMVADNDSCVDPTTIDGGQADVMTEEVAAAPVKPSVKQKAPAQPKLSQPSAALSKVIYHKVSAGDTLWNIAQKYNTTIQEIKKANGINGSQIKIGSKLKVPINS